MEVTRMQKKRLFEITMPKLNPTMNYGMIVRWLKQEGDHVRKGEPLVEIEAEKVSTFIESPVDGILSQILVAEGADVEVGARLAVIELESIKEAYSETKEVAPTAPVPPSTIVPLTTIRKVIADKMAQSHSTIPHITLIMEVNVDEVIKLRQKLKEIHNKEISYNAFFMKATERALRKYPILNSTFEENGIRIYSEINIGLAVATKEGLVVPVIRDVGKRELVEISDNIEELIQKARENKLSMEEVSGGTFTITNLGMFGVDAFTPIIVPGQSAILGIGQIKERIYLENGKISSRKVITLNLSCDHRVVDGAVAAEFLQEIKKLLEVPESLLKN